MTMTDLQKKPAHSDALAPVPDEDVTPEHRAWMNDQIEQALELKLSGKATYKTTEETRRKFGPIKAYSLHDAPQAVHNELIYGIDAILDAKPDV